MSTQLTYLIIFVALTAYPLIKSEVTVTTDKGQITFWYNSSNTHVATFLFDYCDIAPCPGPTWQCRERLTQAPEIYICVTDNYWGQDCKDWGAVGWNTGQDWGYKPPSALNKKDENGKSLISRMTLQWRTESPQSVGKCPKLNSRDGIVEKRTGSKFYQLILNIENPQPGDAGTYVIGKWAWGGNDRPVGRFRLQDMYASAEYGKFKTEKLTNPLKPHIQVFGGMTAISNPTYKDTLAAETGFTDVNLWLEWMRYSANQYNKSNCYVCGAARPHLGAVPLNLPSNIEECFLGLFTNSSSDDKTCTEWKNKYPILTKTLKPGEGIQIYPGNYTCYNGSDRGKNLGMLGPEYCAHYSTIGADKLQNMSQSIGDVYWICGDMKIRSRMTGQWRGECALAKAIMGLHMFQEGNGILEQDPTTGSRRKRELKGSLDPHVYIDAIGVPRGVPNEFKARDQVAAGFESIIPIITVNKNVDWINYIYYNQQRFINYTKDALQGIAEQLQADSTMTFQNRMSLDMVLAEKGGVCVMLKLTSTCCTWIPDNVGPNGKTTAAIKKLTDLSEELKKNSGIDNSWDQYFGWFKGWKQALVQVGIVIVIVLLCAGIIFCCVFPILKKLCVNSVTQVTTMYQETGRKEGKDYTTYLLKYKEQKRLRKERKNHII